MINDILRAQYLLKVEHGVESLIEEERENDAELANWVFETRMEIEQAESAEELFAIQMSV